MCENAGDSDLGFHGYGEMWVVAEEVVDKCGFGFTSSTHLPSLSSCLCMRTQDIDSFNVDLIIRVELVYGVRQMSLPYDVDPLIALTVRFHRIDRVYHFLITVRGASCHTRRLGV